MSRYACTFRKNRHCDLPANMMKIRWTLVHICDVDVNINSLGCPLPSFRHEHHIVVCPCRCFAARGRACVSLDPNLVIDGQELSWFSQEINSNPNQVNRYKEASLYKLDGISSCSYVPPQSRALVTLRDSLKYTFSTPALVVYRSRHVPKGSPVINLAQLFSWTPSDYESWVVSGSCAHPESELLGLFHRPN